MASAVDICTVLTVSYSMDLSRSQFVSFDIPVRLLLVGGVVDLTITPSKDETVRCGFSQRECISTGWL